MASFSFAFAPYNSSTTTITTAASATATTAKIRSAYSRKTYQKVMNGTIFCCQKTNHARINSNVISSVSPAAKTAAAAVASRQGLTEVDGGIGILHFLHGKNYFVTGCTGFLAKVLIEKLLRTVPEIGKNFVLIKTKDVEAAMKRFKTEIIDSELFKRIEQMYGKSYKSWMRSKLIPIVGDVSQYNLGMDDSSAREVASEVNIIINSAATTTFDERFDVALNINTNGPTRLLHFAKRCDKLLLFMHVSTAYVNGERQGIIPEKPFYMGESIAGEKVGVKTPAIIPVLDVENEIKLASELIKSVPENQVAEKMKELGIERAKMHGWENTYVFTKAMGEMMISSTRGDIPVVIIRPTIVESTYKEPFPGWIQGNRMMDPVIVSYGKGELPGFIGNPETIVDVVPADMVVNLVLTAMAKHGNVGKSDLNIYHISSSVVNPIQYDDIFKFAREYFTLNPLMDSNGDKITLSDFKFRSSLDEFSSFIHQEIVGQSEVSNATISDRGRKKAEHLTRMAQVYEPYAFYAGWFDNGNTRKLIQEMSMKEKREFGCEVGSINWEKYFTEVHIPGLRKHVMKARLVS